MAWKRLACASLVAIATAAPAAADWNSFWHGFHIDYHRNNAWPHPFSEMAATQTRTPFAIQTMNGWRLHNTVSHELFRGGDGVLTVAGQHHLAHIISQVPPQHRMVMVVRGATPEETEARLASVRSAIARMHVEGPAPEVRVTDRVPATGSGELATALNRARLQTLPAPRLPESEGPSVSTP